MATSRRRGRAHYPRLRLLALGTLAAILCIFVVNKIEPVIYHWRVRTVEATYGSAEISIRVHGLILRTEEIISAPAPGRITLLVGEGRRVRTGDPVAEVFNESARDQNEATVEEINRQLRRAQANYESNIGTLKRAEEDLEDALETARRSLSQALSSGDEHAARSALERRNAVSDELQRNRQQLAVLRDEYLRREEALLEERQQHLNLRPASAMLVVAPKPGVVSFSVDGYEHFGPGVELMNVPRTRPAASRVHDGLQVKSGEPLFRLVDMAAPVEVVVTSRHAFPFSPGAHLEMAFDHDPGNTFTGRLVEVVESGRDWLGRIVLEYADQSLVHRRHDTVSLSANRAEGIVVPTRALFDQDGRLGVYVMLGDRPIFRDVSVLGGNDQRVVIDAPRGVPVGAPVVLNPHLVHRRGR